MSLRPSESSKKGERELMRVSVIRILAPIGAACLAAAGVLAGASPVAAQDANQSTAFTTTVFAAAGTIPGGTSISDPDDITSMDGLIFVSWQNGVGPNGEPAGSVTQSTVVEYASSGKVINSWQLAGRCDGLSADSAHDRLIATVNEDGNSSLYVIKPAAAGPGQQLVHYTYSPNPLVHGGGTDAPHMYRGQIFISASNPSSAVGPAVYSATLSGTTATLAPVFFDNSKATEANKNFAAFGTQVTLALTDPDSNFVVPNSSPRFAGDFVLDSQGDGQQIYAHNAGTASQQLFVLNLSSEAGPAGASTSVDDTVWATSPNGTLYATNGSNAVFAIRGTFVPGTAFAAVTPGSANTPSSMPSWLGKLDLNTGVIARVNSVTIQPKGLLFVGVGDQDEQGNDNTNNQSE
jgi:hypothetical protein